MRVKPPFFTLVAMVLVFAVPPPVTAQARGEPGDEACTVPPEIRSVRLAGLDRHGDLLLADGIVVRLAGLAPSQGESERERLKAALSPWHGHEFGLVALGNADRWGRIPGRLLTPAEPFEQSVPRDLAAILLAAGAALRLPEPGLAGCNELWRTAETGAFAAASGAADAATKAANLASAGVTVIDGHDAAAMRAQAGRIVLVEGRIAAVGERTQRTYLNFTRRRGAGASIVLSRALWRELQRVGWTASTLTGKRVRVRGVVEGRDGLLIAIESRTALEMID